MIEDELRHGLRLRAAEPPGEPDLLQAVRARVRLRRRRQAAGAIAATLVGAGAAVLVAVSGHRTASSPLKVGGTPTTIPVSQPAPTTVPTLTPTSTSTLVPGPWKPMADSPLSVRGGPVYAWTGKRLLIWGGFNFQTSAENELGDGAVYDPAHDRWTPMSASPLAPRSAAVSAWDGHELLIWGGLTNTCCQLIDGAAYDPAADHWTLLPAGPLPAQRAVSAQGVWSGQELLIWISDPGIGAAYNPQNRRWRSLPPAPLRPRGGALVAWDGTGLVVAGGALSNTNSTSVFDGASYDPVTNRWRTMPSVPASPVNWVLTSDGLVVQARTSDPSSAPLFFLLDTHATRWRALAAPPQSGPTYGQPPILNPNALLWTGTEILAPGWYGSGLGPSDSGGAALDVAADRWRVLPSGGQSSGGNGAYAWTGTELVEWGGQGWGAGVTYNNGFFLRESG